MSSLKTPNCLSHHSPPQFDRCWPLTQSACGRYCSLWVTRTTVLLSSRSSSRIPACIRWSLRWTSRAEKGSSWVDRRKQEQARWWVTLDVKTVDVHALVWGLTPLGCVALDSVPNLSGPQLPHLKMGYQSSFSNRSNHKHFLSPEPPVTPHSLLCPNSLAP